MCVCGVCVHVVCVPCASGSSAACAVCMLLCCRAWCCCVVPCGCDLRVSSPCPGSSDARTCGAFQAGPRHAHDCGTLRASGSSAACAVRMLLCCRAQCCCAMPYGRDLRVSSPCPGSSDAPTCGAIQASPCHAHDPSSSDAHTCGAIQAGPCHAHMSWDPSRDASMAWVVVWGFACGVMVVLTRVPHTHFCFLHCWVGMWGHDVHVYVCVCVHTCQRCAVAKRQWPALRVSYFFILGQKGHRGNHLRGQSHICAHSTAKEYHNDVWLCRHRHSTCTATPNTNTWIPHGHLKYLHLPMVS